MTAKSCSEPYSINSISPLQEDKECREVGLFHRADILDIAARRILSRQADSHRDHTLIHVAYCEN